MPTLFSKTYTEERASTSFYDTPGETPHSVPPPPTSPSAPPEIPQQSKGEKQITHQLQPHHSALLTDHTRHPVGFFSTFTPYPQQVSFSNQNANEEVLLFLRKHWATNLPWIVTGVIGMFVPLLFPFFFSFFSLNDPTLLFVLTLMYYLFLIGFLLGEFITWFYNVGIVTNLQIVDIDFSALSSKKVSTAELINIEEAHAHQSGFFQSLLNYGDVMMRTKSEMSSLEFSLVPYPVKVNDLILDLITGK